MEICIKWKVCRVCLTENVTKDMSAIHTDAKLANQIYECAGVMVCENDTLPDKICDKCTRLLKNAVHFRRLCRNSDQYLQSVMRKTKTATDLLKLDKPNDEELDLDVPMEYEPIYDESNEQADTTGDGEVTKTVKEATTKTTTKPTTAIKPPQHKEHLKDAEEYVDARQNNKTQQRNLIELFEEEDAEEFQANLIEETFIPKITSETGINDVGSYIQEDEDGVAEVDEEAGEHTFMYKNDSDYNNKDEQTTECEEDDEAEGDTTNIDQDNDNLLVGDDPIVFILKDNEIKQEGMERFDSVVGVTEDDSNLEPSAGIANVIQMDADIMVDDDEESNQSDGDDYNKDEVVEFLEDETGDEANSSSAHVSPQKPAKNTTTRKISSEKAAAAVMRQKTNSRQRLSSTWKKVGDVSVFVCDLCGNHFTNRNLMNHHMRMHRNEKNFECELCFKRFNAACNLTAHMRVHTGEKPYECQYCNRRFADRSTHIKHERIHTNEKPFTCTICNKSFALSTTLRAHEKVHTGEKPYTCEPCSKSFKLPHQLKAHLKTHLHKLLTLDGQI